MQRTLALLALLLPTVAHAQDVDLGAPFGTVRMIDEVQCGDPSDPHELREAPSGASRVETILGESARSMTNDGDARYFAYRIGAGAGLVPGRAYVLEVSYPEDSPRTMFIANRGAETVRGFSTGTAFGDAAGGYTNNLLESYDYPLSGGYESWRMLFFLNERFADIQLARGPDPRPGRPEDGFWVIVAQLASSDDPLSHGAAVARIRLYEVPDFDALIAPIHYPPDDLPRRFVFWREEMSDNLVGTRDGNQPVFDDEAHFWESQLQTMQFLGFNAYGKDLLEFGANQGWDSTDYGGNDWVYQSDNPGRWQTILDLLGERDLYAMPYYEYTGSKGGSGLGFERRSEPLSRPPYDPDRSPQKCGGYTHITWSEVANVDVTDPDTFEDLRRMLELTMVRHTDRVRFAGAWIRTRVSDLPIGFGDATRARFAEEANGGVAVSRDELASDTELYDRYVEWWDGHRLAFFEQVRDYLRGQVASDLDVLFTPYAGEPGPPTPNGVITDDVSRIDALGLDGHDFSSFVAGDDYLDAALAPQVDWRDGDCGTMYEWRHANPSPDLDAWRSADGLMFTFPFNRLFTVSSSSVIDPFRSAAGLAMVRHFPLNENRMADRLGYFVSDVDRAGPYGMLAEARAVANGDPRYLGYLSAHIYNRAWPEHVRAFNQAFLALPALPSRVEEGAASDPDVVVRSIPTEAHGTYLAVVHTGLRPLTGVTITLPSSGAVRDLVRDADITVENGSVVLDFAPGQLYALHLEAAVPPVDAGVPSTSDGAIAYEDGGISGSDAGEHTMVGTCGCRAAGRSSPAPIALVALALLTFVRRRR